MGSATLCFSRWSQRRRRQLHCVQNRRKHRARLLTEKALRSRGSVRPGEEKVVNGGEALSLARQIESAKLMAAQGQGAVSPLHIGTRALKPGRQPLGLVMELALSLRAQRTQDATGFKQRGAEPLGELAKRCAIADASSLDHAIEIIRGNQLGVHREGDRRRHIELSDLLPHIPGDKRDGRLHFRHHALGFVNAFQAALAESFLLGNGANLLDVLLDIRSDQLAIAAHPALKIDKVVSVANATDARLDLVTVLSDTLVL